MNGPLSRIAHINLNAKTKRLSSYDVTGGNADYQFLAAGEKRVIARGQGSGCITHLWFTMWSEKDVSIRSNVVLRIRWDGAEYASVAAPIGEFFGNAWGENYEFASLPLICAPRGGRAMVCYWPMPYEEGFEIELENQSDQALDRLYFYVDYEERDLEAVEGRFHAQYRQEFTTPDSPNGELDAMPPEIPNPTNKNNYVFCEAEGPGHYVGVNYYVQSPTPLWYGEGDDMFCIDGEPYPYSLHGTGTEDYFNTAWSPESWFQHPLFGLARVPGTEPGLAEGWTNRDYHYWWLGRAHVYRFHLDDPIRFNTSLHASMEHGHGNTLSLFLSSVAYWYQPSVMPLKGELASAAERAPMPKVIDQDVHRWRAEYLKSHPDDRWGTGWRTKN